MKLTGLLYPELTLPILRRNSENISETRAVWINHLAQVIPAIIYAVPALIIYALLNVSSFNNGVHYFTMAVSPMLYAFFFIMTAGLISSFTHGRIVPGKFPRNAGHAVYSMRKIYGTCWTTVYYCKPVYYLLLTLPFFKTTGLRLFGYKGSLNVTIYPDTWLRDLPLLEIEDGAYLSNRCTIGTNMCVKDGSIAVGKIKIGRNSVIGHLAMIALGTEVGSNSEIGVGCTIGTQVTIGNNTTTGGECLISHYARIGSNVQIGHKCFVGAGAFIADGIKLPNCTAVPDRAKLFSQDDVKIFTGIKAS